MSHPFLDPISIVLPYFNLVLVAVVIIFFVRMFIRESHKHIFILPWKILFVSVLLFIIIESLTILRHAQLISYPHFTIHGFLEMGIITLFIYMLLLQKEHIKKKGY